jgi:hypothetical protein
MGWRYNVQTIEHKCRNMCETGLTELIELSAEEIQATSDAERASLAIGAT